MTGWILSCSVLIAIVLVIKGALYGKINMRLNYGLWIIVLIRLLVPVSPVRSPVSIMNLLPVKTETQQNQSIRETNNSADAADAQKFTAINHVNSAMVDTGVQKNNENKAGYAPTSGLEAPENTVNLAYIIWSVGALAVAATLTVSNVSFALRLRRNRKKLNVETAGLPVYITDLIETPCMSGIFKPAVFVTTETLKDVTVRRYVVEHEITHYRHGDHIWSVLRVLCLVIHWYNPLMWVAVFLSKRDSEFACDEGTIKRIGESERAEYGKTLIGMTCKGTFGNVLSISTAMIGRRSSIKERIKMIAKSPRNIGIVLAVLVAAAAAAVLVTFTSPQMHEDIAEENSKIKTEYLLSGNAEYKQYEFDEVIYFPPFISSYPVNGTGQQYWISDKSIVIIDEQTGNISSMTSVPENIGMAVDEEYWRGKFSSYIGDPVQLINGYKSITEFKFSTQYAVYYADDEVWLAINSDDGEIIKLYRLKQPSHVAIIGGADAPASILLTSDNSVVWDYEPMLSSKYPAFCFELKTKFSSVKANCDRGILISYDTHLPDGYPQGKTVVFTAGSRIYWSPCEENGETAERAVLNFSVMDGGHVLSKACFDIEQIGRGNGKTTYATWLNGTDDFKLIQNQDFGGGAILLPKNLPLAETDYSVAEDADIQTLIAMLPGFDWNYYSLGEGGDCAALVGKLYDYVGTVNLTEEQYFNIMCGTHGLDGAYSEGYADILAIIKQKDPELFNRSYNELPEIQQGIIDMYLYFAEG